MTRRAPAAVVHIALVAMLLRALVPAGWMPGTAFHQATLIFCPMDAPMPMGMDGTTGGPMAMGMDGTTGGPMAMGGHTTPGGSKHAPASDHQRPLCSYAMSAHVVAPGALGPLLPPQRVAIGEDRDDASIATGRRAYAPQSPRAPPHLA